MTWSRGTVNNAIARYCLLRPQSFLAACSIFPRFAQEEIAPKVREMDRDSKMCPVGCSALVLWSILCASVLCVL